LICLRAQRLALLPALLVALAAAPGARPAAANVRAVCADFPNQAAAQRAANTRDPDHDGVFCESLPCPCLRPGSPDPPPPPPPPPPKPRPVARPCHAGPKADRRCTPGGSLRGVTRGNVCTPGWASRHRHVTTTQRHRIFARYRIPYRLHSRYELDHLIALEVGGNNADRNLWPQPGFPNGKDKVENRLHRAVCSGSLTLRAAQRRLVGGYTRRY